jgi:spore coat polysaccharide biosynthesis protein SpsF
MKIAAIVQARMRSSRMPGKVMRPIADRPMLWHVIHRLRKSRLLQEIVIATTPETADDRIAAFAQDEGLVCVRGPEDNVLQRFRLAAEAVNPDVILRVNADAPLLDPVFADTLLRALIREKADLVTLPEGVVAAHDGIDPMSRRALDYLLQHACDDPVAREHVTGWFKQHPGILKTAIAEVGPELRFEGARLSVDTPSDLAFIEAAYDRLQAQAGEASLSDLIGLLRREPALLAINAHVKQKAPEAPSGTVLIRCDGGRAMGLGHVKRSLALAHELQARQGLGCIFVMRDGEARTLPEAQGFVTEILGAQPEAEALARIGTAWRAAALVVDTREGPNEAALKALRPSFAAIAVIDDAGPRRLAADIVALPPVPQTRRLAWQGGTDLLIGWQYTILGEAPVRAARPLVSERETLRVLIAMGGSDPARLTPTAAEAVARFGGRVRPVVVLGPSVAAAGEMQEAVLAVAPDAEIVIGPERVSAVAKDCDLAVVSYGVSALECAHLGVPAVYLCLTPDHAESASAADAAGFGTSLGLARDPDRIEAALDRLIADPARRRAMAAAGRLAVDGRGAERIAAEIARHLAGAASRPAGFMLNRA